MRCIDERATFCIHVRFHQDVADPVFGFALRNTEDDRLVVGESRDRFTGEQFKAGEHIIVYFNFDKYDLTADGRKAVEDAAASCQVSITSRSGVPGVRSAAGTCKPRALNRTVQSSPARFSTD